MAHSEQNPACSVSAGKDQTMHVEIERALEVLARTPGAVRSLLGGLSHPWVLACGGCA